MGFDFKGLVGLGRVSQMGFFGFFGLGGFIWLELDGRWMMLWRLVGCCEGGVGGGLWWWLGGWGRGDGRRGGMGGRGMGGRGDDREVV